MTSWDTSVASPSIRSASGTVSRTANGVGYSVAPTYGRDSPIMDTSICVGGVAPDYSTPTERIADASASTCSPICSTTNAPTYTVGSSMPAVGTMCAPTSIGPLEGTDVATGGACPTDDMAVLAPLRPDRGAMPVDYCCITRRATLFFGASTRGF